MRKIQLLDCTLRDGGYVNDWKFGQTDLVCIFERLVDSGVDIIEIGFLDERRPYDKDRSIMPDTESAKKIYGTLDRKDSLVVGMIDYGTCGIKNIQPCAESCLDGIRVIFKKHLMHQAMDFCRKLKELGYKVFSQLVSITSYADDELLELAGLVNDVAPYVVSMVDTYGLCHPEDVRHFGSILEENVIPDVRIGFHGHNNLQLAYANALAFIDMGLKHDIVVDGTLYGLGKSAGNAPLELLAMRLDKKYGGRYRVNPMLEAIQESVMRIYESSPWGYKTFFYLCAMNRCHPNYLSYYEQKEDFSASKMNGLLAKIQPEEKKLLYDKDIAEDIYKDYMSNECNDVDAKRRFREDIAEREILLIGPGKNISLQKEKVESFILEHAPYVISVNYIPKGLKADCVFITKFNRYHDMALVMEEERERGIHTLATANVECRNGAFDFVINKSPLLERGERIPDNPFIMLLGLLTQLEVKKLACAGFDGYSDKEENYFIPAMEYSFVKAEAAHLNRHVKKRIAEFREKMDIRFITYSAYDVEEDIYSASI